jgi:hypothetical protein
MPHIIDSDELTVTLKLTYFEAAAVAALCGRVGGDTKNSPRRHVLPLWKLLTKECSVCPDISLLGAGFDHHVDPESRGLFFLSYPRYDLRYVKLHKEILAKTDMARLVAFVGGEATPIDGKEGAFRVQCPFHAISDAGEQGLVVDGADIYCEKCGWTGDAVGFARDANHWSKWKAMNMLALRAGIPMGQEAGDEGDVLSELTPEQMDAYVKWRADVIGAYVQAGVAAGGL